MKTYNLSSLTVEDIPLLEPLEEEARLAFWGNENYRKFLEEYPEYFGSKVLVGSQGGEQSLAGFFLARSVFDNLEILKVGVFPVYQRKGVGKLLLEAAYAEGVQRGCRRCFLEVRKSNGAAIQFYYSQKFRIAGTRLNYYSDPVEDAWIMERSL